MKNWKQWIFVAIIVLFGMVGFTACDQDGDENNGGGSGDT